MLIGGQIRYCRLATFNHHHHNHQHHHHDTRLTYYIHYKFDENYIQGLKICHVTMKSHLSDVNTSPSLWMVNKSSFLSCRKELHHSRVGPGRLACINILNSMLVRKGLLYKKLSKSQTWHSGGFEEKKLVNATFWQQKCVNYHFLTFVLKIKV